MEEEVDCIASEYDSSSPSHTLRMQTRKLLDSNHCQPRPGNKIKSVSHLVDEGLLPRLSKNLLNIMDNNM